MPGTKLWGVTSIARTRLWIVLSLAVALAACQRARPPAPPAETLRADGPSTAQRRAEEAKWLSAFPEVGTREGSTLVLRHAGLEVGHYSDDPQGCNPYSISKVVRLYDAASGRLQPVAEVTCHFGSMDNRYLVLPDSDKYTVRDDVSASPDGRRLAVADNSLTPIGGQFTLVDWPSMARVAAFKAGCRSATWQDATHLTAVCWHNEGAQPQDADDTRAVFFTAEIHQDGGQWLMDATGFVDAATGRPVVAGGRALPHLVGYAPPPDRP